MFYELCPICLNSLAKNFIKYSDDEDIWYCHNKICLAKYYLTYYKHNTQFLLYSESFYCGLISVRNLFIEKACCLYNVKNITTITLPTYISPNITLEKLKSYIMLA